MPTTQIESQFVDELLAATRDVFETMVVDVWARRRLFVELIVTRSASQ
jgi:hypothetical protein